MHIKVKDYIRDPPRNSISLATGDTIDQLFIDYQVESAKKLKDMVLVESDTHELFAVDNILLIKDDQHSLLLLETFGKEFQSNQTKSI